MNTSSPLADNPNKYVIISDYIKNNADLEPVTSLTDITDNLAKFQAVNDKAQESKISSQEAIDKVIASYTTNNKILFVQNMIQFLKDNQLFLNNLSDALLDINKMSLEFKTKIENSK